MSPRFIKPLAFHSRQVLHLTFLALLPVVVLADEIGPDTCGRPVIVSGEVTHHRANIPAGSTLDASIYGEEIYGDSFTATVEGLPPGRYTILVQLAESYHRAPDQRLIRISHLDKVLVDDLDIFEKAGGKDQALKLTFQIEHEADEIRGPLAVVFKATKNKAKINAIEIQNAAGKAVACFKAKDLQRLSRSPHDRIPEISTSSIYRDSTKAMDARIDDLVARMSLTERSLQLNHRAPAIPRLGVPAYNYWNESLHGVARNGVATVFPQAIAMAATWNEALIHRVGGVIAAEGRSKYYATIRTGDIGRENAGLNFWAPNVNIFRDPRWGRGHETYGEDPFLTTRIGVNYVQGLQATDSRFPGYVKAMATAKHFAVHSGPEEGRGHFNVSPVPRDLYETYLPQFQALVQEANVWGVMAAYNSINGIPCAADPWLLTKLLRDQWGFKGHVVSDCGAIGQISGEKKFIPNRLEAVSASVKSGMDLACGSDFKLLPEAVDAGFLEEADINRALRRVLEIRFRLGLFDSPQSAPFADAPATDIESPAHLALALETARESMTLLKNDGILPLNRSKLRRIAVVGPNANNKYMLHANYHGESTRPITVLEGIKTLAGPGIEVTYTGGVPLFQRADRPAPAPAEIEKAVRLAQNADLVIFVGGLDTGLEGEESRLEAPGFRHGDRTQIELPDIQARLIAQLREAGKPLVFVNCSGSSVAFGSILNQASAILQAWYPGAEGGKAVAEVLFGDYNPAGRLPVTFYARTEDLPPFEDYSMRNRTYRFFTGSPEFPFGHGLSYTSFTYGTVEGAKPGAKVSSGGSLDLRIQLKNAGRVAGDEVVQVYVRAKNSKAVHPDPIRSLVAFRRVPLTAGASALVDFKIPVERLRSWNEKAKSYAVEPGDYLLEFGSSSTDIRQSLSLRVE
jgi:beta-glucosidase